MTNEIKEILGILDGRKKMYLHQQKNNSPFNDEYYMAYMLLDYIINLQEENKRLKEDNYLLIDYQDMEIRYNEYKQRIDKAIKYIENDIDLTGINGFEKLLDILRGNE